MDISNWILKYFHAGVCPHLDLENGWTGYNSPVVDGGYPEYTRVSFSCKSYHQREGAGSATCQNSGNWSHKAPKCIASNENTFEFFLNDFH